MFMFFLFNDTATTGIYTYGHTLSYTTLFRSRACAGAEATVAADGRPSPQSCRRSVAGAGGSAAGPRTGSQAMVRSEEHTSELQSLMRISYAVFCLKKTKTQQGQR